MVWWVNELKEHTGKVGVKKKDVAKSKGSHCGQPRRGGGWERVQAPLDQSGRMDNPSGCPSPSPKLGLLEGTRTPKSVA